MLTPRALPALLLALLLGFTLSCSGRPADLPGDFGATDGFRAMTDSYRPEGPSTFCSGAAKMSINGSTMMLEQVTGEDYNSAAHEEGARVRLLASASSGQRWVVHAEAMLGLGRTLINEPLPKTAEIGPPAGLEAGIFFSKQPVCSGPLCSELLSTEHQTLSGHLTLSGKDYRGPLQLSLCLTATDAGSKLHSLPAHQHEIHSAQIYIPAVTIPRWRLSWAP